VGSILLNHEQAPAYNEAFWGIAASPHEVIVIHTLVVHPAFWKQGLAQKFLDFTKSYALRQNAKAIRLDVSIQNTPAISLYEKCGYTYIGTVDLGLGYEHLKWFRLYELCIEPVGVYTQPLP
jgi:RimJ/RimL family protein N-acetyltransferase